MNRKVDASSSGSSNTENAIRHPRHGELTRHRAVCLGAPHDPTFWRHHPRTPPYIHLSVTGRCHARCKGCINAAVTFMGDADRRIQAPIGDTVPRRDAACIAELLRSQPEQEGIVCFYGGEPLLATDKMVEVVRGIEEAGLEKDVRYMLYTNGDLLGRAVAEHPEFMARLWLTSVSIDGTAAQHEAIRLGTRLDRIHAGLERLREVRRGQVLMWSTLREEQSLADCFEEFLLLRGQGLVEHFFYHWAEGHEPLVDLAGYGNRYERDLVFILETFLEFLERGELLSIVHLNELLLYALSGRRRTTSACAVETARNFDLLDGRIHSCADLPLELAIGEINEDGSPRFREGYDLSGLVGYKKSLGCRGCGVHGYCGGRCPVQAQVDDHRRLHQYCQLMRLHVGVVLDFLPRIEKLLRDSNTNAQSVYDRSAFYAQFTDVTP